MQAKNVRKFREKYQALVNLPPEYICPGDQKMVDLMTAIIEDIEGVNHNES